MVGFRVLHVFWNCGFAYGVWNRMGSRCRTLTGVSFIKMEGSNVWDECMW